MTTLLLTCNRCYSDVDIHVESAILRTEVVPAPWAELLFNCPVCGGADAQPLGATVLALLLQVGTHPVALSEPTLDACDTPPAGQRFEWQDVLDWHEQLTRTTSVEPWM
jgi:hypothetical protein